jgi:dipeptidyl aminopeptidase/acylaminoacyl peptidase
MSNLASRFSLQDLLDIESPSDVRLSPNGEWIAFVLGKSNKPDQDTPFQKAIHILQVSTRHSQLLAATDSGTNDQPCWSLDSRKLAFVSNRADADEAQLYIHYITTEQTHQLTHLRGKVDTPKWLPQGDTISFLYDGTSDPKKRPDPDPVVVDAEPIFKRVWTLDVESGQLTAITPPNYHIFEYAWSCDGTKLAVLTSSHPNPAEGWYAAQIHTIDIASGEMQQVCTVRNQIGRLTWSPDGRLIAFVSGVMSDEGNVSGEVYVVPAEAGEVLCITPGIDHSITWIEWRDEGILYGGRHIDSAVLGWINPHTQTAYAISEGMYSINGFGPQCVQTASNGTFAALRQSFTEPANIYIGSLKNDNWQQLTDLPTNWEAFPPLRVENKHWVGADGMPVHGFLIYPPDYEPGKQYPLFTHVHGGPSWSYVPHYVSAWERILTARGCLVLMPNPRGSWGRGHAYQSANVGDLGGGDWGDINAGVDCMIAEGLADPERLAIGGWSYGGYLVTWAVTQTDRFRCAIAGASITSYESNYGVVSNREWQTTMFGSNVYDDYELHRSRSPLAFASRVKTPTLLVHGLLDPYAPPQQAIEFYQALKHFDVPTRLVLYPREPHGFQERAHQLDLYQQIINWIDQYLLG